MEDQEKKFSRFKKKMVKFSQEVENKMNEVASAVNQHYKETQYDLDR